MTAGLTQEVIYTPPPPGDLPALMAELVAWLKEVHDITTFYLNV